MNLARLSALISLVLLLSSCALLRTQAEDTPAVMLYKNISVHLPQPAALGFNGSVTQILTATYHLTNSAQTYSSQVEIEKTNNKLVMVALSGFGAQLFSLQYNGTQIHSSSLPMPNASMGIKHALADFIFTYAPTATLQLMLHDTGFQIVTSQRQRMIRYKNKVIIEIHYQHTNPWQGKVTLTNLVLHYHIEINTVALKLEEKPS